MITSSHNSIQVDVNHECGGIVSIGGDPTVSALCPGNKGSSFPPPCIHACYKNLRIITHKSFKTFFLTEKF